LDSAFHLFGGSPLPLFFLVIYFSQDVNYYFYTNNSLTAVSQNANDGKTAGVGDWLIAVRMKTTLKIVSAEGVMDCRKNVSTAKQGSQEKLF